VTEWQVTASRPGCDRRRGHGLPGLSLPGEPPGFNSESTWHHVNDHNGRITIRDTLSTGW